MDIKSVLKKINFKLILFRPNFFTFYFIFFHYYFSYFILINSFSNDLEKCPPPSSTTIRRRPNFFTFYFIFSHYYFSYFILINSFSIDLEKCPPPSSTTIRRRRRPPLSVIAVPFHLSLTTADNHRLLLIITVDRH